VQALVLVARLPVPPWRGDQMRAYHLMRILARRHDITCCALTWREPSAERRAEVEALGVRLVTVPLGIAGALPALGRVLLGDPRPLQVLLYLRRRAQRAVAAVIAAGRFDVVHAQLVRTVPYLPDDGPPVVLDLIDALSANFGRRARRERGPLALVAAFEAARLARFEPAAMARADRRLAVSAVDAALLGGDIDVVPNGVDADAFAFVDGPRPPSRLVFAGNLGYFPNVDAAVWLAREIFPRVRAAIPDAELRLVGARPARAVRALTALPGVSLRAEVPWMPTELADATVAMVPMRSGTGLQNKVLEAMAVGTPVVTTPQVAEPLTARAGEHFLVGEDAAGLADAALALLRAPARARAMAAAARAVVESRYRWDTFADAVEAVWRAVAPRG
jgi:sugar transferase (PEP-CTERM/EpsH1 system associated)